VGVRAVPGRPRDGDALPWLQLERGAPLDLDGQRAFQDEEELVLGIVRAPMEVAVHHAQAHDRVVHLGQRAVPPRRMVVGDALDVDLLERSEQQLRGDVV